MAIRLDGTRGTNWSSTRPDSRLTRRGIAGDFMSAPSSTQKHLTERYWREGDSLRMDLTVEDPIFLLGLINFVMEWRRSDQPLSLPWDCDPEAGPA